MEQYIVRVEQLKGVNVAPAPAPAPKKAAASGDGKAGGGGGKDDDDENSKFREGLSSVINTESPNVKWDDVAGLAGAKESLKEAVILPIRFPQLFQGKRKPWCAPSRPPNCNFLSLALASVSPQHVARSPPSRIRARVVRPR
jgi:vacuolar protein-sorting-associated protein 4